MKAPRMHRSAFTLIEILVAMSVLTLLVALLAGALQGVSRTWQQSQAKMDNFARGRALLGALDRDLRQAVIRQDLPAFPTTQVDGEPALAFFTRAVGQETDTGNLRPLTYVTYFRDATGTVTRRDQPFDFGASFSAWTPFPSSPAPAPADPVTPLDRKLCPGVIAFHFEFLQSDGTVSNNFAGAPLKAGARTQLDPSQPRTVAVRLSLAILSEQALALLNASGKVADLASLLQARAAASTGGAKGAWDKLSASDPEWIALGLPPVILGSLRTYEGVTRLEEAAVSIAP